MHFKYLMLDLQGFIDRYNRANLPVGDSRQSHVMQWPDWFARFCSDQRPERMGLRFDRAVMSLDATVQKLGVALESASIGQSLIASGKLQPVFEDPLSLEVQAHFMVYPARHASRPEVKCFGEWLRGGAVNLTPRLTGAAKARSIVGSTLAMKMPKA